MHRAERAKPLCDVNGLRELRPASVLDKCLKPDLQVCKYPAFSCSSRMFRRKEEARSTLHATLLTRVTHATHSERISKAGNVSQHFGARL